MGVIDTHCHIHDREFFSAEQQQEFLAQAKQAGVEAVVTIGTNVEDSLNAQKFAMENANEQDKNFPKIYWTFGIHPEAAKTEKQVREMVEAARESLRKCFETEGEVKPVAIGEIGLDYHYGRENREAQLALFEGMLKIADEYKLPVSFHVRKAFEDFFPIVAKFPKVWGIVHCFSDNKKNLRRVLTETDFLVAVNGMATYSTLPTPPLTRTVLETDAPFLAPREHRGQINQPAYVVEVAEWLAEKLQISVEEAKKETTENARGLFNI